jgi:transposase
MLDWADASLGKWCGCARGFEVRLVEPLQARALLGRRRSAKTDRLDARWLARLLAKEMLPESSKP